MSLFRVANTFRPYFELIQSHLSEGKELVDKELIELARVHSNSYAGKKESKKNIVLVHPLYFMRDRKFLTENTIVDIKKYENNLEKLLSIKRDNLSIVLYESPLGYISHTGNILEEKSGIIDKVIFSKQDSGSPANKSEMHFFAEKSLFVGGAYNGTCLSNAISHIRELSNPKKIRAISGLVIESPVFNKYSLFPRKVIDYEGKRVWQSHINNALRSR